MCKDGPRRTVCCSGRYWPARFIGVKSRVRSPVTSVLSNAMGEIVVLDGGFASQLARRVDQPVDGTPLWSASFLATNPQACVNTHLDFLQAGANVVCTNTFQASINGFMTHLSLSKEESVDLIKKAVSLAKDAVTKYLNEKNWSSGAVKPLIVGSVGPYGAVLNDGSEFTGSYIDNVSQEQLIEWHRPRVEALVEAGVDLIAFETIPAQMEGEALMQLLKEFPQQKAWLTFSCKDDAHTSRGEKFVDAIQSCWQLNSNQVVAMGTNCVNPRYVTPLVESVRKNNTLRDIPLIVYPNSGEIYEASTGSWLAGSACRSIETYVQEWLELGVRYVGGCCRMYPPDIAKIAELVEKWKRSQST